VLHDLLQLSFKQWMPLNIIKKVPLLVLLYCEFV
jgi:hypothetical protein